MSFDSKLSRTCDHREVEEEHYALADHVTVVTDLPVANFNDIVVRVNDTVWPRDNQSESFSIEDVTSQVDGLNNTFLVSGAPIIDGSGKRITASRVTDVIVRVSVFDEDVSAQFTGFENVVVTSHRPLLSKFDVFSPVVLTSDVEVKVNSIPVNVVSIEPRFGKIVLENAPLSGDTVTVSYSYRARVSTLNAGSGLVTTLEIPTIGQIVEIFYFKLVNNGWRIEIVPVNNQSKYHITFDLPRQTNTELSANEDVSSQFTGTQTSFVTQHKNIIPPNAGPKTDPKNTLVTSVFVSYNGQQIIPIRVDAINGVVDLGFAPDPFSTILTTYNYRSGAPTDLISIDYNVIKTKCRKCKGLDVLNDFDYDALGQLIIVEKEFKMLQDLKKFILAIKGSNGAHPWYGTSMIKYIGTARIPEYYIVKFKGEILDSSAKIKDLQNQQTQFQVVDDEEFINFLDQVIVEQNSSNPNQYEISVTIISQAQTAIELNSDILFNSATVNNLI